MLKSQFLQEIEINPAKIMLVKAVTSFSDVNFEF